MKTIPLSIPYLVPSIEQHLNGMRQIHARTPFGCIDISVKVIEGIHSTPLFDITVEGDLDSWILDHRMPSAFRNTLFKLIGKIAVAHSGWPVPKQCQLVAHFKGITDYLTVTGQLNMADYVWRIDSETPRRIFF